MLPIEAIMESWSGMRTTSTSTGRAAGSSVKILTGNVNLYYRWALAQCDKSVVLLYSYAVRYEGV